MKRVTMILKLRVTYSKGDDTQITEEELGQLERNLDYIPQYLAGNGALTDDAFDVIVDQWSGDVAVLKRP